MPFDAAPETRTAVRTDCLVCPVQRCLGRVGEGAGSNWAAALAPRQAVMPNGPALFEAGERLNAVYSVRAGCLKTSTFDADGHEHVRAFHLPGDVIGLDALHGGTCRSTATAVAPSQVCVAPLPAMRQALAGSPKLAQRFTEQASRELALALAINGAYTAEQRMAAFLMQMAARLETADGLLVLPMPQRDIGSYLRLATETVCRMLKQFAKRGLIRAEARGLRIVDRAALAALAEPVGLDEPLRAAA